MLTARMPHRAAAQAGRRPDPMNPAKPTRRSHGPTSRRAGSTTTPRPPSRTLDRAIATLAALGALGALLLLAPTAAAQPTKGGDRVLRTPPPGGKPGDKPGGKPGPTSVGGKPGQPGAPGGPGPDPTEVLRQAARDIEFQPKGAYERITFNLDDADLLELIKAISAITGRRFIYSSPKLKKMTVTVHAPEKVTVAEAYQAFLSALEINGLTVIPHGRFLKIVESKGAERLTTPLLGTATPVPYEDRFITRLYRLTHVDAATVSDVLSKFKSPDGTIHTYDASNLLIITDTGTNIRRMLRIVEELDAGGAGDRIWLQPIHYIAAADLAAMLSELLDIGKPGGSGRGGGGASSRVVADERSNTLILIATEGDYLRLLELIKRLDVPDTGESGIHVLPLQHAQCDEIEQTLNSILGGTSSARRPSSARGSKSARAAPTSTAGSIEHVFEGEVRVSCDVATNSLITVSSLRDYAQLRTVIDQLDRARRQVFIEAVVMDVNIDHTTDLGLGYHGGFTEDLGGSGDTVFYGGMNAQQSMLGIPGNLEAMAFGVRGPDLEGSSNLLGTGVSIPGLGIVLHALARSGDSNVLATPHILATDNIPATISIGQNIPLQTNIGGMSSLAGLAGSAAGTGSTGSAGLGALGGLLGGYGMGFSAPRQDVGIKLEITPHINDSDQVRMEIKEEFSDAGSPTGALGAVPINKRTADTTIVVRDQQTVVIGGLVRESHVNGETKVPVLGDIPVLGVLFRQTKTTKQKTNLLLILTPHIVRTQDDLRRIFERKMQQRQEFLDRYFVFGQTTPWEPEQDFGRTNGLVEHIRQTQRKLEERARLAEEMKSKGEKTHEPTTPLPLPSMAGASSRRTNPTRRVPPARTEKPSTGDGKATRARPKLRVPGSKGGSSRSRVE